LQPSETFPYKIAGGAEIRPLFDAGMAAIEADREKNDQWKPGSAFVEV
jgi:hypothetical protein